MYSKALTVQTATCCSYGRSSRQLRSWFIGDQAASALGRTLLRDLRVHLADRLLHALGGAHVEHLLHRLLGRVDRYELHSRAPVLLGEAHVHLPGGHVGIDVAIGVREGIL